MLSGKTDGFPVSVPFNGLVHREGITNESENDHVRIPLVNQMWKRHEYKSEAAGYDTLTQLEVG